jgi:hypothetical protein
MGAVGIIGAFFSLFMITDPRKNLKLEKYERYDKTPPPSRPEKKTFKGFL